MPVSKVLAAVSGGCPDHFYQHWIGLKEDIKFRITPADIAVFSSRPSPFLLIRFNEIVKADGLCGFIQFYIRA